MNEPLDGDQRSLIGAAALAALREHGVAGLTVRRVADGAGCSTTGVYTWFGGKQGLLDTLFTRAFRDFRHTVFPEGDATDLAKASRLYRQWALAHPDEYLLMFAGRASGYAPSSAAWVEADRAYAQLVDAVTHATRASDAQPGEVAAQLWAFLHGRVMLELAGPPTEPQDPAEVLDAGVATILAQVPR